MQPLSYYWEGGSYIKLCCSDGEQFLPMNSDWKEHKISLETLKGPFRRLLASRGGPLLLNSHRSNKTGLVPVRDPMRERMIRNQLHLVCVWLQRLLTHSSDFEADLDVSGLYGKAESCWGMLGLALS